MSKSVALDDAKGFETLNKDDSSVKYLNKQSGVFDSQVLNLSDKISKAQLHQNFMSSSRDFVRDKLVVNMAKGESRYN